MRIWWLCLLIALMPLRLWAGSAMLVEHAHGTPQAVAHAPSAIGADHPCHTPAGELAGANAHDGHGEPLLASDTQGGAEHASCVACDICHTLAHPWVHAGLPWVPGVQAVPMHRVHAPTSAGPTLTFKPPIA